MSVEVEQLREACRAAEEELAAVRQKLRNAVKKGKAIDEERHGLQQRVLELEETLSKAEAPGEGEVEALRASVADYREKLKNAVRKGKGIEAERQALLQRVEQLEAQQQGGATGAAVEELQAAVMSYKEKLKDAVAKGQAMEEERNELQRRLAEHEESARRQELEAAVADYKEKLKTAVKKGKAIQADRDSKAAELEETLAAVKKAESRAEEAVEKIRVQQEALRMAASRIAEADREAAEARRSAEEAARERNEVLRKLREAADGRDAAASSAAELKAAKEKIVATTLEAQKVASELEEAKIGLQARADQLLRSDQARAAAERELRAANERLGAVEVLLAKLTEEQANLGLEELGAKLQESRARADAAEAEITSLRSQLGDAMARAEQAEETNREQLAARRAAEEGHEERVRVALAEVQDLRGKLEEAKEEAKRESKAFKEEEMRLRAALSEAGQELETVRRDGWGLEADDRGSSSVAEIGELRRELKAALQEAEQSRARVSELMEAASAGGGGTSSDELQAARATAQELRRNLEEHKREADKKSKALKSERAKLLAALEEAEKKTEAQSELEVEAGEMQRRLDAALQEVSMMKAAMAAAAERIKVSREAEEKLEAESAGKSNEVADLRRRLAEMEGKLHLLEHLEEDNRALRSRLEEARAAAEDAVRGEAGAREAARASVKRAEDLEAKLSMAVTDTRTLEAQHNAKMEELEAMRAELQEQISAAEEASREADQRARAASRREEEAAQREAAAEQRVAAAQAEARRIAAEAEERSKRFAHVQSMFSMKEAAFSGRLAEAQGEAEAARSLSAEARAEASSLKEQLGVMEKEAGELRAGIEALEQANLDMVDQVTSLEEELVAAQADAGQLDVVRSQLAEAEKRSEELSAEAERLETENAALRLQMEAAEVAASKSEEQVQHLLCRVEAAGRVADALRSDRDEGIRGLQEQQREEAGEEQGEVAQVAVSTDTGEDEDVERLRQENEDLRQRVAVADRRLEAAAAAQLARIASLEKTNRQLSWQVAMTTASSGQAMPLSGLEEGRPRPAPVLQAAASSGSAPSGISLASVVGWVLAHRKLLVAAYLVILHLMVYFALTHGAFSFSTYANKPTCEAPPPALLAMAPGSVSVSQLPPPSNAARPPFLADLGTVDELIRAAEKIDRAKPADPALEVSGSGRGGGGGGAVAGEASAVNQDNPSNPEAEVQQAQRQGADHMAGKGAAQGGAVEAQGKAA